MNRLTHIISLSALLCSIAAFSTGCLVVGACDDYEVCEVYCDDYGCFEECYIEEGYCDDGYYGGGDYYGDDYYDDDYYGDGYDDDGEPTPIDDETTGGTAGFCQACSSDNDCVEPGALCIQINGTENVCARTCNSDNPCPRGFECRDVSQQVGVSDQCIPIADPEDDYTRSCVIPEEAECIEDRDCANGEWCNDEGRCEIGDRPECQYNSDCAEGLVCAEGACAEPEPAACLTSADCAEGELCIDGTCVGEEPDPAACEADDQCAEGMICLDGACSAPECIRSTDCAEGNVCVNARCEAACASFEDCAEGQSCNELGYCE
ncbi:MAG: hypothetical protein CMH57_06860 [Myxococcales bacterium]|nr:hypothetical protein [Myxococcales bacterium]